MPADQWKKSFRDKLQQAQSKCATQFEAALEKTVVPVFEEFSGFLRENGFKLSRPLREQGHRSFKFELAENAYLLFIYKFTCVGEFELRTEIFSPGSEPVLKKNPCRVADVNKKWVEQVFEAGLDELVDLLNRAAEEKATPELVPA